jgi:FkbM family methyltransferase
MSTSNDRVGQLFLRYALPLAGLRRVPVLGSFVRWASGKIVPRDSLAWVQIRHGPAEGLWLRLNPRTGGNYFQGGGEPEVQTAMRRHLRPGMTFYDIGANIGFFSLLAARIIGPEGRVVAFEADPEVAQRFRDHVERNHFSTISIEQKAVWSETRPVFFARTDPETSPDRGLGHVVAGSAASAIRVQATSLDDFLQTSLAPDFLKCDVEGAEVEVFSGAKRLLKENRPILLCEIHSEENRRVLLEEFTRLGYKCESLSQNHILALQE